MLHCLQFSAADAELDLQFLQREAFGLGHELPGKEELQDHHRAEKGKGVPPRGLRYDGTEENGSAGGHDRIRTRVFPESPHRSQSSLRQSAFAHS